MSHLRKTPDSSRFSPDKLALARERRKAPTPSERQAWEIVRNRQLLGLKFRREHPIGGYVVDLFCAQLRLCIEIDGSAHDDPEQAEIDEQRRAVLKSLGLRVIRVPAGSLDRAALEAIVAPLLDTASRSKC